MKAKSAIIAKIDDIICAHPRPNDFASTLLKRLRSRYSSSSTINPNYSKLLVSQSYTYLSDLFYELHLSPHQEHLIVDVFCELFTELGHSSSVSDQLLLNKSSSHSSSHLSFLSSTIYEHFFGATHSTRLRYTLLLQPLRFAFHLASRPFYFLLTSFRKLISLSFNLIPLTVGNLSQRTSPLRSVRLARPFSKRLARPTSSVAKSLSIGIVVPSYNHAEFLEETLSSLYSQNYPLLYVHVQDACSTDGTPEILQKYASLHPHTFTYRVEPDNGQSDAINRGFQALPSTDLMGWLNSDDIHLPGLLSAYSAYFSTHPAIDVLYSDRLLIDASSKVVGRWQLPPHRDTDLFVAFWVPQETMMWRRSAWEVTGSSLDSSLNFAIDWDLCLRFFNAGMRFAHLPFLFGALRVHPSQKSQSIIEDVGLYEMDLVRLKNHVKIVPRHSQAHKYYLLGFYLRQKIFSFLSLLRSLLASNSILYADPNSLNGH